MSTHYIYGTILTGEAVAANNRGDNMGNTTTLQKVFHYDDLHTTVSAEAIRFALRYRFQLENLNPNRTYVDEKLKYADEEWAYFDPKGQVRIDDDLMGFMNAKAAASERENEDATDGEDTETSGTSPKPSKGKGRSKDKPQGKVTKRPSPLAVGRAISLRPYRGELSFNAVSGEKAKGKLSLYNAEMHTTEYQYSFGLNLGDVIHKEHIGHLLDAIADPPHVAGNHARFSYDFSPESIVLRFTSAHSSRIQNCFEHDSATRGFHIDRLIQRLESGDLPASELIVGGAIANTVHGEKLKALGVTVLPGVDAAIREARTRIGKLGGPYAAVGPKGAKA